MIPEFQNLTQDEQKLMFKTPILVTSLVAGADNKIDKSEIREAIFVAHRRVKDGRPKMQGFFAHIDPTFEADLRSFIKDLPKKASEHQPLIIAELEKVNGILKKVEKSFAVQFYNGMRDFGRHIAQASGGLGALLSVSPEENEMLKLKMLEDPELW